MRSACEGHRVKCSMKTAKIESCLDFVQAFRCRPCYALYWAGLVAP